MVLKTHLYLQSDPQALTLCLQQLQENKPVVFPTETVYGLACSARHKENEKIIYAIKERDPAKPLALMVSDVAELEKFGLIYDQGIRQIMNQFWPGALTIVFPLVTGGTLGVRIPDHPFVLELLKKAGPLYVTSANLSGKKDAINAEMAYQYFQGGVEVIVDGGECIGGTPSTVILAENGIRVLREGALTQDILLAYHQYKSV